jgi:hypothetical protein
VPLHRRRSPCRPGRPPCPLVPIALSHRPRMQKDSAGVSAARVWDEPQQCPLTLSSRRLGRSDLTRSVKALPPSANCQTAPHRQSGVSQRAMVGHTGTPPCPIGETRFEPGRARPHARAADRGGSTALRAALRALHREGRAGRADRNRAVLATLDATDGTRGSPRLTRADRTDRADRPYPDRDRWVRP